MCGILGITFLDSAIKEQSGMVKYVLRGLLSESASRGRNATGIAVIQEKDIVVVKEPVSAHQLIGSSEFNTACSGYINENTISILGHCRLKTKGTPRIRHNNHPIIANNVIGVHNGMIVNDDVLFEKYKKKCKSFKRKAEVDSEIIFRLVDYFTHVKNRGIATAIDKATFALKGSYACAMVDRTRPYMLWLFRDINPIYIYHYPKSGVIVFASSKYFIDKAVDDVCIREFGKPKEIELKSCHCMGINLKTSAMHMFKLRSCYHDESCYYTL